MKGAEISAIVVECFGFPLSFQVNAVIGHDLFLPDPFILTIHDHLSVSFNAIQALQLKQHY
jgi:hypothetical protein